MGMLIGPRSAFAILECLDASFIFAHTASYSTLSSPRKAIAQLRQLHRPLSLLFNQLTQAVLQSIVAAVRHGNVGKNSVLLQGLSAALRHSLLSRSRQPLQHQRGLCERRASISESRAEAERVVGVESQRIQLRVFFVSRAPLSGKVTGSQRTGVQASLLGVGAPEALLIGVVALLVFGPKGLAEVARTVGKSLRTFQPTIKELQQVSREFKATLEQEIGLDELRNPSTYDSPPMSTPSRSNSGSSTPTSIPTTLSATEAPPAAPKTEEAPAQPKPYTTEDYVRITEEQANALVTEEQRNASEAAAWGGTPPVKPVEETPSEGQPQSSTDSAIKVGSGVVGSTPTEPLEKSNENGSPKL